MATSSSPWAAAARTIAAKASASPPPHEGDLYQYAGIETLTNPLPAYRRGQYTAGTASEVTRHCVLTNTETKVKFVIVSWRNLPSVSINDPLLMIGKPAALTGGDRDGCPDPRRRGLYLQRR
ncbi:alcohol dehydrogenase [Klebsiella pneumoniae]|uniref:Alcohol dehydrogenase n=1 Tax=Klebsiella pneumoniae TaxID=573 RepID=A0A378BB69_KLEPN|nr:alcohol dehydrogenase [Klebsiella pneumoniae]